MNRKNIITTKPLAITIIGGSGRMGQWFQSFFKNQGIEVTIHGRKSLKNLQDAVKEADIIMLAVPIAQMEKTIEDLTPYLTKDQLLCDIASLKTTVMKAMEKTPCEVLGMHPLFGPSIQSPQGLKIVFCTKKKTQKTKFLKKLFIDSGMEVLEMSPIDHDKQMALLQGLVHSLNILFEQTLQTSDIPLNDKLQTPLFRLQSLVAKRVLQQESHMVTDIQLLNPYFLSVLEELRTHITTLITLNKAQNRTQLQYNFESLQQSHEHEASYALQQTNRILQMIDEKPVVIPQPSKDSQSITASTAAYLGPEGTNTHVVTQSLIKNSSKLFPKETISDIFTAVEQGRVDIGVVPAENSLHGTVRETLDLLSQSPLHVIGSLSQPIHHALLSLETDLKTITKVVSHPQALSQCKGWLKTHLPQAKLISADSTTSSLTSPQKNTGYIASEEAGRLYQIPVLHRNIEDSQTNITRFYVLSQQDGTIEGLNSANTLLFLTIYNRVGILRDILDVFTQHNISLNKLESRPSLEKVWDYCFYVEVDQQKDSQTLSKALNELKGYCPIMRVLGRT